MFNLELVGEAKTVFLKAWSSRFAVLSTGFGLISAASAFQVQLPLIQPFVSPKWFGLLTVACAAASALSRVIKQPKLRDETGPANGQPVDDVPPNPPLGS